MKKCPRCGKGNTNNSNYCEYCGENLTNYKPGDDDKTKKAMTSIIGALAIGLVVGGSILLINHRERVSGGISTSTETAATSQTSSEAASEHAPKLEPIPDSEPEQEQVVLPSSIPDEYYVYDGHTYGFYNAKVLGLDSYYQVSEFCRNQGGHLAAIDNQRENNYLFELLRNNYTKTAFFGYSDEEREGNWQWDYGDGEYDNWTQYGMRQPDNGAGYRTEEDYAEFNYDGANNSPNDGTWNDAPFRRNTDMFICEWEYDLVEAQK